MHYGDLIREARERRNLTQLELAEHCGTSNSTVSNWERGVSRPDPGETNTICRLLGIPNDVLLTHMGYDLSIGLSGKLPRALLVDLVDCSPEVLVAIQRLAELGAAAARRERES